MKIWIDDVEYILTPKNQETENGSGTFICELNGEKWYLGKEAPKKMNWGEATQWAAENDLILPPREILLMCYINKNTRRFFKDIYYWSGTEYNSSYAWFQSWCSSGPGNQINVSKASEARVRSVYSLGAQ